jgi:tetratricopeptide (TPR) repeat protein
MKNSFGVKDTRQDKKNLNPSEDDIKNLLDQYQNENYLNAENLALSITEKFPNHLFVLKILGAIYDKKNRINDSLDLNRRVIELSPNDAEAHYNLGVSLKKLNQFEKAELSYKKAILLNPNFAEAHNNLGNVLKELNKLEKAKVSYKKAILLNPNFAEAHNNLGNVLKELNKLEKAKVSYKKAILLNPNFAEAHNNLGNVLKELGNLNEAKINLEKAITLKNDYNEAYYNLSSVFNLRGDLLTGLKFYEWRLIKEEPTARPPRTKFIWDGIKSLKGKKFLVYEEQGLGDIIQFYRYLPLLEEKGAEVTFKVKTRLHKLLKSSNNKVKLTSDFPKDNNIEFESPLLSIPYLLKTDVKTIPANIPYLKANSIKVAEWKNKLSTKKFKVGICWQGSKNKVDRGRSFSISNFNDISKIPNLELINLYKGEEEKQILDIDFKVTTFDKSLDEEENAFIDTSAIMMNCDLIITSDTVIAHLAGALGCPVWVVLKYVPDWRWMLDRQDSPWYPTTKLYRQNNLDDWVPVFNQIKNDLENILK